MDDLLRLRDMKPHELHISLNAYRSFADTPEEYYLGPPRDLNPDIVGDIVWTDPVFELQIYPENPIGFYLGVSNDLEALVQWANEIMAAHYLDRMTHPYPSTQGEHHEEDHPRQ